MKRVRFRNYKPAPEAPEVAPAPTDQLLYDRLKARKMLGGISQSKIIELEQVGLLHPVKFDRGNNAKRYYRAAEIQKVAEHGIDLVKNDAA